MGLCPPPRSPSRGTSLRLVLLHSPKKEQNQPRVGGGGRRGAALGALRDGRDPGVTKHPRGDRGRLPRTTQKPGACPRGSVAAGMGSPGPAPLRWKRLEKAPRGPGCARPASAGFAARPRAARVPRADTGCCSWVTVSSSRGPSGRRVPRRGLGPEPSGLWGPVRGPEASPGPPPVAVLPATAALPALPWARPRGRACSGVGSGLRRAGCCE